MAKETLTAPKADAKTEEISAVLQKTQSELAEALTEIEKLKLKNDRLNRRLTNLLYLIRLER